MDRRVQKHGFGRLTSSSAEPAVDHGLQIGDVCGCRCWRQVGRGRPCIQQPCCADTCTPGRTAGTGSGPCYLADLIDSYEPSRCLRSTNCHLLAVPSCAKSSFASRAFCVSSPNNWNSLPAHIRSADSLVTSQSRLKSHLFSSAYHV